MICSTSGKVNFTDSFIALTFDLRHALQLRQAKLSFSNVYLLVGINSDEDVEHHKARSVMSHTERFVFIFSSGANTHGAISRCEAVRHCRWVDEVIPDCPWVLDTSFLDKWEIDYVAHDEEPYMSEGHEDVYAFVKRQGDPFDILQLEGINILTKASRKVPPYSSHSRRLDV